MHTQSGMQPEYKTTPYGQRFARFSDRKFTLSKIDLEIVLRIKTNNIKNKHEWNLTAYLVMVDSHVSKASCERDSQISFCISLGL